MERNIHLSFPFQINNVEQKDDLKVVLERKENAVSFSLPFQINVSTENATLKSVKKYNENYIYVLVFKDLSSAKTFVKNPVLNARYDVRKSVKELEKEANDFMVDYENIEKRSSQKIKVYDDEGFYEYK